MKHALIAATMLIAGSTGANAQSMLKVRLADSRPINVSVDGRYFNKRGTSVTVGDLPPGNHTLRIYIMQFNRHGRGYEEIAYEGRISTYNGEITMFTYDAGSDGISETRQDIEGYNGYNQPQGQQYAGNGGGDNNGYNGQQQQQAPPVPPQQPAPQADDVPYSPSSPPVASPIAATDMGSLTDAKRDKIKSKVSAQKTDTEKLKTLKSSLKDERLSTDEVSLMMDWFSFESGKLEFGKWAFSQTVDKENYANLINKFTYKQYQDELEQFISGSH